jgi:hypothetical protein
MDSRPVQPLPWVVNLEEQKEPKPSKHIAVHQDDRPVEVPQGLNYLM